MYSEGKNTENEDILPFPAEDLPKHVLRKCEDELNETPDRKEKALQELRTMLQNNPETTGINFYEDFLTQFLRRNKYRMKDAYQNVLNLVDITRKESLFIRNADMYLDSPMTRALLLLPKKCPDGCTVIITRFGKWNPNEIPFEHMKSMLAISILQLLRDPVTQISGIKFIHDFKGASVQHLKYCSPRNLHLLYHGAINCLPGRYKAIHCVNESFVLKTIWALMKPFLSEKLKNRVVFHSNSEGLFDYFPRSMIPAEYGGTLLDNDIKDWIRMAYKCHEGYTVAGQPNFY
ncbi:alpha-tocopherol transfer protein-like [Argiope bruennichi]|uniref:Alpha-tocopherol transfer protein-like n=1 Tax=Argiope bruennichi TaxID=94029 RepID=A0A8T0EX24_ARGBR|nr:alpha-tocopherol transfer protein-like [Argiope bruennichi]KAF8778835.1 Alpha-tocopherol transfer protein-like [Argiope bruennichi]